MIGFNDLAKAINFGMKENLSTQFIYPDYALPCEYENLINNIDHVNIKPAKIAGKDDIAVGELSDFTAREMPSNIVLRSTIANLSKNIEKIINLSFEKDRLNLILTDIATASNDDIELYRKFLYQSVSAIIQRCTNGERIPQLNVLTDRLTLTGMNNCNAGNETITVAPDGKFYVCPAFYYGGRNDCGSVAEGTTIKNQQLYRLEYAPICRDCDAWQCHRCVWLNMEKTLEVNTPGHSQCVISHLERNASRELLAGLRKTGDFMPGTEIPEISYLDPFEKLKL